MRFQSPMSARRNQADCLAGATLSKSVQDGNLTVEDGDMEEITAFLIDFADGDTHGTPEQQVGLFIFGYDSADIEACLFNRGVPPPGWFGPCDRMHPPRPAGIFVHQ